MNDIVVLKAACDEIISDKSLQPELDPITGKILKTHCNEGATLVSNALGCHDLDGQIADEQYATMLRNSTGRWKQVNGLSAVQWALAGGLGFAALPSSRLEEAHGHIAAIYPVPMQFSASLDKYVPVVANVGAHNLEEKESMAFPVAHGEADYFIWS